MKSHFRRSASGKLGKDPYYSEDHFGIVHKDFTPKPAYEALRSRMGTR